MSAPQQGRQSPDPKDQSGKQGGDPAASNPNKQGQASHDTEPEEKSDESLKDLESNPKHVMEGHAKDKTN